MTGSVAANILEPRRRASQRLAKAWPMQSAKSSQIVSFIAMDLRLGFETKKAQLNAGLFHINFDI
jgi:hypothetical protein